MFEYPAGAPGGYPSAVPYYAPRSFVPAQFQAAPMGRPAPMELIKVNGRAGAEAFRLEAPNSRVALFDANEDIFFIKRTDGAGYPTVEAYKFTRAEETPQPQTHDFVSRKEFDDFKISLEEALKDVQQSVLKVRPAASTAAGK